MSKSVARTKLLVAACAAALLAAGCNPSGPGNTASRSPSASASASTDQLEQEYQRVVKNVLPSVVQITTGSALGSGIVYDDKGDIVTNAHVVGSSTDFEVTLPNNDKVLKATLLSSYPAQDLAVIKLNNPLKGLRAAKFGDSSKVEVGQITLAMGSPLGLSGSVTQGIVSAVGRTVSEGQSGGGTGATIANMVQTSAPINPGNSGGALVNLSGEVIGIPTLAATDPDLGNSAAAGIGFAIPASTVTRVANQIIKNGKVTESGRAALGIVGRTVLNADFEPAGVAIVSVVPGGPADKAGLRAGDIITKVGTTAVTTIQSLSEALVAYTPGNKVKVTYERDGKTATVTVALGKL
ncbi:S1C family serine protease [Actinacidiphila oryziradicis]|uniref:PDZ domain-containing protein n=1 Tax=Actinacidiphila oryziradicis TaxID=2571141 RepID=A0A4U0SG85_9ACTN|nr:trypsin-like peptidase domain-containing protein [Actinacidiphila oryziradicis]TKA08604.1 PDZ domain-containing protein [Actinacidiphila oryziradicis]